MAVLPSRAWSEGPKCVRFRVTAGTIDVEAANAGAVLWQLPDGTTSTATRLTGTTVTPGVVACRAANWGAANSTLHIRDSTARYSDFALPARLQAVHIEGTSHTSPLQVDLPWSRLPKYLDKLVLKYMTGGGALSDLPRHMTYLWIDNVSTAYPQHILCTGTLADLPRGLIYVMLLYAGSGITGTFAQLPRAATSVLLYYLPNIGGSLADVPSGAAMLTLHTLGTANTVSGGLADLPANLLSLYFVGCGTGVTGNLSSLQLAATASAVRVKSMPNIAGALSSYPNTLGMLQAYDCGYAPEDTDALLIGLDGSGKTNGTATLETNRTAASDAALASLEGKGWTVTFA